MANKKYQIFISSTYTDLVEERKAVQEVILKMYQIPIGMEMFSADNEEQWEVIKETIDSSDYYVLIIGRRYGSTTEEGISYTEKEYQYAKSNNIPILAFIIGNNVPLTVDKMESDKEKLESLERFIHDAQTGRMVEWWNSKEELAMKVSLSLQKQISRGKRPGWIRSDVINVEATQNELVEMSKKIRLLEQENENLKSRIIERKPDIDIEINGEKTLKLQGGICDENLIRMKYKKLVMEDDVPNEFKNDITQEELDEYNSSLPTDDELNKYINEWKYYTMLTENNIKIEVDISNIGTIKASNLYVDIEFPSDIVVYEVKKLKKLEAPIQPTKGINPIEICYENKSGSSFLRNYKNIFPNYNENIWKRTNFVDLADFDYNTTAYHSYYIEDNTIHIWEKELIHTRKLILEDRYCICALKKGDYNIKCNIICEEFKEPIEQNIALTVQ